MYRIIAILTVALLATTAGYAQPSQGMRLGDAAPTTLAFTDHTGKPHTLAEFRGKPVVLEWTNYGCPFVNKHYGSGNMQALQQDYTGKGVAWISVISSAPGKQGYLTPKEAPAAVEKMGFKGTLVAQDPSGTLGRLFNAQTTPHMFVLDASGKLVYMGAIDSIPSFSKEDVAKATNHVKAALDETLAGKPVTTAQTNPYGCSIKY